MPSGKRPAADPRRGDSATVAARIAELLRDDIIRGNLLAGARINEVALAKRYHVSRIPLREALRIMEGQGLVEIHPFSGAFVGELSADDVRDIWETHEALETLALKLAFPHLTADDLRVAESIARNAEREPDPRRALELVGEFYATLYGNIGRRRLLDMLRALLDGEARYLYAYLAAVRAHKAKLPGPRAFLAVLRKRNLEEALDYLGALRRAQREFFMQNLANPQLSLAGEPKPGAKGPRK